DEVAELVKRALKHLEHLGASMRVVKTPSYLLGRACAYAILHSEAASFHEKWFAEQPMKYGRGLRALRKAGQQIPATTYVKALRVRKLLRREYDALFTEVDALILPMKTTAA